MKSYIFLTSLLLTLVITIKWINYEYKNGGLDNNPLRVLSTLGLIVLMAASFSWYVFSGPSENRGPKKDSIREAAEVVEEFKKETRKIEEVSIDKVNIFQKNLEENESAKEKFLKLPQIK